MKEFNILGKKYVVISGENYSLLANMISESLGVLRNAEDKCYDLYWDKLDGNKYVSAKNLGDLYLAADKINMAEVRLELALKALE